MRHFSRQTCDGQVSSIRKYLKLGIKLLHYIKANLWVWTCLMRLIISFVVHLINQNKKIVYF
jgi:hypothetical protein